VARRAVLFTALASLAIVAASAGPASADSLGKVESSHQSSGSSSSSSSSSSSRKSSRGGGLASAILGGILSSLARSGGSSGEGGDEAVPSPPRGLAMDSYGAADDLPSAYAPLRGPDARLARDGELSLAGFSTITSNIRALDAQMNVFFSALTMHLAVTRYYEPDAEHVRSLDLLRLQVGANVFHGWVDVAELHLTGGVLALHGNEWTPGGSVRADLRLYPYRPFSFEVIADASFFAHGPPLLEGQVLPGLTFARLDLRAGVGALFNSGVAPIIGPRIQAGIRF
jgi:hypothetical protein